MIGFRRRMTLLVLTTNRAACSRSLPLAHTARTALAGKRLVGVRHAMPSLIFTRPGTGAITGLFGVLGALAAQELEVQHGNQIVYVYDLPDPASEIAQALAWRLETALGVEYTGIGETPAQLALDVETLYWQVAYRPHDWDRYAMIYHARVRLIDTLRLRVLAQALCSSDPFFSVRPSAARLHTYDELLTNNASGLRRELDLTVDDCVDELASRCFLLDPAEPAPHRTVTPAPARVTIDIPLR